MKKKTTFYRYHEYANGTRGFVSQKYFRGVWESFVSKQRWDLFSCPYCKRPGFKHESDKVIMDGVAIGVQEYRCDTTINPKTIFKDESVVVEMGKLGRTRFTATPTDQQKLISLVVTQTGNFKRDCKIKKFNKKESANALNWALGKPRYKSFANFLIWCSRIDDSGNIPESMFDF